MKRPWVLADLNYRDLQTQLPSVVVLPFGATEPHNYHLPYSTDTLEADLIAGSACQYAYERGAAVLCLPSIPYGTETNQYRFPLSLNLHPSTILTILKDLVQSIERSQIYKLVILNSHGGNEFKGHLRELYSHTKVHIFLCNWYKIASDLYTEVFQEREDHGGEMETSLILHHRPDLVALAQADAGQVRPVRFEAVQRGWVDLTRPWHLLTPSSGAGNPQHATAAKGARWLEIVTERLGQFLIELAQAPLDDDFPFAPQNTSPA